jgi:hypothetical protein
MKLRSEFRLRNMEFSIDVSELQVTHLDQILRWVQS